MSNKLKVLFSIMVSIILVTGVIGFTLNLNAGKIASSDDTSEIEFTEGEAFLSTDYNEAFTEVLTDTVIGDNFNKDYEYTDELIDKQTSETNNIFHREGYTQTQVTFVSWDYNPDASDPDQKGRDEIRKLDTISPREGADIALQCLYNMFGYQVDSCYAIITYESEGRCDISFGHESTVANNWFFCADIDTGTGIIIGMNFNYNSNQLPINDLYRFDGIENADYEEIAQYYYDNSSYGDRRSIVSTEYFELSGDVSGEVADKFCRLYVESGEFYEVFFDLELGLPSHFWGPYPVGFEH